MNKTDIISKEVSEGWDQPQVVVVKNTALPAGEIARLKDLLSPEERVKSERFRLPHDRDSYTIVHGLLRRILAEYYQVSPSAVEITYDAFGKPSVAGNRANMFFNLSHSAGVSVLAFDRDHEIGVDVEQIRKDFEYRPIVDGFFAKEDMQFLGSPEGRSVAGFYKIWTRKEALLKAIGTGIGENLAISVSGPVSSGFRLNTMMFGKQYVITVATNPMSGGIRTILN
jgi:4'-phosphopantetheinyl transferase